MHVKDTTMIPTTTATTALNLLSLTVPSKPDKTSSTRPRTGWKTSSWEDSVLNTRDTWNRLRIALDPSPFTTVTVFVSLFVVTTGMSACDPERLSRAFRGRSRATTCTLDMIGDLSLSRKDSTADGRPRKCVESLVCERLLISAA
jgi:hypothetical protein